VALPSADITSSDFKARAYDYYAQLRAQAPVQTAKVLGNTAWLVSRYDDVASLLKDARLAKDRHNAKGSRPFSRLPGVLGFLQAIERNMLDLDAPDHTRLRGLVHLAFTPRLVDRMRARIEGLSEELLARAMAKGTMDVIADYALPIPLTVISEMLGIPTADQHRFNRWSNTIVASTAAPNLIRVLPAIWRFVRYLRKVIADKRVRPQDDLITALVQAEEAGDRLREDELVAMVFLLVVAGHETTVNLIGNGTYALLRHRDQLERWRDDPSLDTNAVDELLRYDAPVQFSRRVTTAELEFGDQTIEPGVFVLTCLASANRDAAKWGPDAQMLDVTRVGASQHVAFGSGIHHCLGAALARLEGRIAVGTLIRRFPRLQLASDTPAWNGRLVLRGLDTLPVGLE
jgi:cytochrome P450